jgi:hypothetical protein
MLALDDAVLATTAVAKFAYNASFDEFTELYDEGPIDSERCTYLTEKFDMMKADVGRFIGQLDEQHRRRFVRLALERYAAKG